jgi:hypothetical protein
MAYSCKSDQHQWQLSIPVQLQVGKPREAPPSVLRSPSVSAALALEKLAMKPTCLVRFLGLFLWKAGKSSNKHPLSPVRQSPANEDLGHQR